MKTLRSISILVLVASMMAGCSAMDTKSTAASAASGDNKEVESGNLYLVQPGDVLEIYVWREKDLQRDVLVRPDGGLTFPLAGDIQASGKTVDQIRKEIATRLQKYVPDAVVTVSTKQAGGNKIYVVGKVARPGEYIATRNLDVMQALTLAGGATPFAALNSIRILRRVDGVQVSIPFKYSQVEKGKNLKQNILLHSGDIIVVP